MKPYYEDDYVTIINDDCIETMRTLPDNSIDSIVTDPPYGLGFMGKEWDALPPGKEWAEECLRVLKPGGHLLAFGGTRTWHRLAVAVEDAGFEIRDSLAWLYGSGFPKSMDVSKAIDKAVGAEREVVGTKTRPDGTQRPNAGNWQTGMGYMGNPATPENLTTPATDAARQWEGWGTALKPAFEPVVMARKPFKGTVAANVLEHGTGALNIDASRIEGRERTNYGLAKSTRSQGATYGTPSASADFDASKGRHPANVLLDEGQAAALDKQSGTLKPASSRTHRVDRAPFQSGAGTLEKDRVYGDTGGASRFFYVAKAPKSERPVVDGLAHPTVKPLAIMRYLVKLVTPPGGTVLEPFAGSGTTVEACMLEGFKCIAIERAAEYLPLIEARINRQETIDTTKGAA